jgi:hypothetical protein
MAGRAALRAVKKGGQGQGRERGGQQRRKRRSFRPSVLFPTSLQ